MPVSERQKRHLRGLAHGLNPIVMVGQHGLKPTIIEELTGALDHHELVKVKIAAGDRKERDAMIEALRAQTGAELIQRIGHVAVFFRRNPRKPVIELPRD